MGLGSNYWELWSTLQCSYVCLYVPKIKRQLWPIGKSFSNFSYNKVCKYGFKDYKSRSSSRLLVEGQQNCMTSSKVITILQMCFFQKKIKNLKCMHVGCLFRDNRLEYCAAHSDVNLGNTPNAYVWSFWFFLNTVKIALIFEPIIQFSCPFIFIIP